MSYMKSTLQARAVMSASAQKYKLVLLGESGVGKTSVVQRLMKNTFNHDLHSTVGASFFRYVCQVDDDVAVHFDIWDTAGQERFRSLASMYYRGAAAALVVFDITSPDSFTKAKSWVAELRLNSNETIIMIVGNKNDLEEQRQVPQREAQTIAEEMNCLYTETSACSGDGVQEAFYAIAAQVVKSKCTLAVRGGGVVAVHRENAASSQQSGCC